MASAEIGGYVLLAGYALLMAVVIKTFGIRRVIAVILGIVLFAFIVAFKTVGAVAGRRY